MLCSNLQPKYVVFVTYSAEIADQHFLHSTGAHEFPLLIIGKVWRCPRQGSIEDWQASHTPLKNGKLTYTFTNELVTSVKNVLFSKKLNISTTELSVHLKHFW